MEQSSIFDNIKGIYEWSFCMILVASIITSIFFNLGLGLIMCSYALFFLVGLKFIKLLRIQDRLIKALMEHMINMHREKTRNEKTKSKKKSKVMGKRRGHPSAKVSKEKTAP